MFTEDLEKQIQALTDVTRSLQDLTRLKSDEALGKLLPLLILEPEYLPPLAEG